MHVPVRLSRKLRDVLGDEAGKDMVSLIDELGSERAALEELRRDLLARMQDLEVKLLREIGEVKSDLMKWSLVFWVGAVAAIATLAGVLKH